MLVIVCDIDNTVADTWPRIMELKEKYNTSIDEFTEEQLNEFMDPFYIKNDSVIKGAERLPELARRCGAKLVFLTGRGECIRRNTRLWLSNKLDVFDTVPLLMRPNGDNRRSQIVKEELFVNSVLPVYKESRFIFFDDDEELLCLYSKYGLALKAPECWSVIKFLDKMDEVKSI